eukprot:4069479-Prymnesium_polylepis.1
MAIDPIHDQASASKSWCVALGVWLWEWPGVVVETLRPFRSNTSRAWLSLSSALLLYRSQLSDRKLAPHGLHVRLLARQGLPAVELLQQRLHAAVDRAVAPATEPDLREATPVGDRQLER